MKKRYNFTCQDLEILALRGILSDNNSVSCEHKIFWNLYDSIDFEKEIVLTVEFDCGDCFDVKKVK